MWPGESVAKRDKKTAAYKRRRQIWLGVAVLLILFAVAGAWKWMPLADQIDIRKITIWVHSIRDNPGGPLIILGAYLGGSLLIIPITVLILATARVFGPLCFRALALASRLPYLPITHQTARGNEPKLAAILRSWRYLSDYFPRSDRRRDNE